MADAAQLLILRQGYEVWNTWRASHANMVIDLTGANLQDFPLVRANLSAANLSGANLQGVTLVDANLRAAILGENNFTPTDLRGANLRSTTMDGETDLSGILIDNAVFMGDIQWNGVDLTVVNWEPVMRLGEEYPQMPIPQIATRAYRQLASQLRAQGMNEIADRFAYRARICRRKELRRQRKYGAVLWSVFLDLLAGYGYRPQRCFIAYLAVNLLFAIVYYSISLASSHALTPLMAFVLSITSFHGRGFFPSSISPSDPLITVAALQAFVGLVIEASFIATFTDRYFGDR